MSCGEIPQRAAFQDGPYVYGRWPCIFCDRRPAACVYFLITDKRGHFIFIHFVSYFSESKMQRKCNEKNFRCICDFIQ